MIWTQPIEHNTGVWRTDGQTDRHQVIAVRAMHARRAAKTRARGFIVCSETDDGLCCRLTKACPKEPEPIPFKDLEVKRTEVALARKLGQGQFGEVWAGKNRPR